jgi:Glycosyltransferase
MSIPTVVAFTDTYLPTVNGVSYTIQTWRDHWRDRGGAMQIVYPATEEYDSTTGEFGIHSFPFPLYDGFRLGLPLLPNALDITDIDIIHAHTPFALGLSGVRLARRVDVPLIASYHTPTGEYTDYLTSQPQVGRIVGAIADRYEQWFLSRADAVICPTHDARDRLKSSIDPDARLTVISNGVDTDFFHPVNELDTTAFRDQYNLPAGPLIGYTGRHGYEKNLTEILHAAAWIKQNSDSLNTEPRTTESTENIDAPHSTLASDAQNGYDQQNSIDDSNFDSLDREPTVVLGGDGPAREEMETLADNLGLSVHFLGFLSREELPVFYSALDVFVFPSPVETQGLVAMEAIACGTPVVGVDAGALSSTIDDGTTGRHYQPDNPAACGAKVIEILTDYDRFMSACLDHRSKLSVTRVVDDILSLYQQAAN